MINSSNSSLQEHIDEYIYKYSNEDDLVQLIGEDGANYRTKRLSASKYSYLPLWGSFTKERKQLIASEMILDIQKNRPKLIFIVNNYYPKFNSVIVRKEEWDKFLDENYRMDLNLINEFIVYIRK